MSAGVETADAVAWAGAVLSGDATWAALVPGSWHMGVAPQGTVAPVCTLWSPSGIETLGVGGIHVWTETTLTVKHSGPQDAFATLHSACARARTLLNRVMGAAQGMTVISCVLTNQFPLPANSQGMLVNGVQWISYVQTYQVLAQ